MHLLRILALLGRGDQTSSEGMYEVLVDVMKRADTGINVGFAIGRIFLLCFPSYRNDSTVLNVFFFFCA